MRKRTICKEILRILREKEIPGDQISKVLTSLTNYTYNAVTQGTPTKQETVSLK